MIKVCKFYGKLSGLLKAYVQLYNLHQWYNFSQNFQHVLFLNKSLLSIYLPTYLPIYLSIYHCCSHLEHWASVKRFVSLQFLNLRQSVGPLGRRISPSKGRYLHTEQYKQNKRKHPCLEWIWTHDPSVRVSEDISCLWLRGHCDRLTYI
jgi:hypothetical protein